MIPQSIRLRRAIHLRSLDLVRRIITSSPQSPNLIRNHDPDDKSNTSLHLAALLGLPEIAAFLLDNGHEASGISRNLDSRTALMLCALAGPDDSDATSRARIEVGRMLIERCPEGNYAMDKEGMNAFMLAARHGTISLLHIILELPPPSDSKYTAFGSPTSWVACTDKKRDTPLHHAAAAGELKVVRLLIEHGADEKAVNKAGWTAQAYSATVSAEVYLRRLVQEREASKIVDGIERSATVIERDVEKRRMRGQVRVVNDEDEDRDGTGEIVEGRYERTRARTAT